MNALLIYPEFPDTFWSFKHALKFIRKKASFPPLGLLTVASMFPEEWVKRLVDVNVANLTDKDLEWADCVFFSSMVVQRKSAHQLIKRCKEAGVKIVAGGPLFTSEHEQFKDVDHFVLNEAEITLPSFLEDLKNGCAKPVYRSPDFADVRETPAPLWKLANLKKYASMGIQYTRGCPYQCEFCDVTALFGRPHGPKTRNRSLMNSILSIIWVGVEMYFSLMTTS